MEIRQETAVRESFVKQRLGHAPHFIEAMDLTRFMHGGPGRLLSCPDCGTLLRDEQNLSNYAEDIYDSALLEQLYPRYLRAFERKRTQYQPLLRNGAEVVELGSHLGAFLQSAEEWGWRPTGLDIGRSTSEFARRQNTRVKRTTLADYSPSLRRPEAVFIWNCFEQLEDPAEALRQSHELLDRHGLLVVRVPNAQFYRDQRRQHSRQSMKLLGYNNLLGFPYLHGYTPATLVQLLRTYQFEPIEVHNSSLLTPPYPSLAGGIQTEWKQIRGEGERHSLWNGPWLEVVSRRH